ncbi:MAG: aldehyde ferredoxin oxidoreductase family protein, partial [Desulfobacterales bacterium]
MQYGYSGKILEIELNQKTSRVNDLPEGDARRFIGGAGLNAWLLYQSLRPSAKAGDPDNPLIFGAGPLVGTPFPTAARSTFTALSPLTGIFGDSNGGGNFGVLIRRAGYDHIIITDISDKPCYLLIAPEGVCKILDADDLWGLDTYETDKLLNKRHPKSMIASIGPAGENLVRYASIQFDRNSHSFSRAGMGAVMGAKKVKAIVVQAHGGGQAPLYDPEAMNDISNTIKQCAKKLAFPRLFTRYGTPMFINIVHSLDLLYGENWRRKISHEEISALDIAAYFDAVESKSHGCFRCPLKCGKQWRIKHGNYRGEKGPKYEVAYIMTLGLTLGLKNVPTVLHFVNKLNKAGLDINEFCGTVGMATDALKKGIINCKMVDGLPLSWGNAEAYESVIDRISYRHGFGDILAEGTKKAAAIIGKGADAYALHMKGMHWPAHSAPPFVMAFSVSTRGGDFLKAMPHLLMQSTNKETCEKLFGSDSETMNIYSHEKKGRAVWWHENYKLILDSLGICFYLGQTLLTHGRLLPEELAEAWSAATGIEASGADLQKAAERGVQVERAINSLQGIDRKRDSFTKRPEKASWGQGINLDHPGMLDEYYAYRGLSKKGLHTKERLIDAELEAVAIVLDKSELLDKRSKKNGYRSLDTIIRNPSANDIGNGVKAKL